MPDSDPQALLRSTASRLESARSILLPALDSGHAAEAAWPMTHLTSTVADLTDEFLFRVSDPAADRGLLAALSGAAEHAARALADIAGTATTLLDPRSDRPPQVREALARADEAVAEAARVLRDAAARLAPAPPPLAATELARHRATRGAALARSAIVSTPPPATAPSTPAAPGATVIPLHRGR
ncbi:hypothetical protein [Kitasatospora phosalacinea]|uniref:Uncharacterized protein n=1 Tax=Kitasatospora phosalacinea TaxID=2065 RepID=A0A9W6PNS9_9ACTN|nr:hypothetical protein [Kitasatospora phosalacinea]GLW58188.1 hypothetical protein Kpho01_61990 [Kitasatospora phosalacinea]